MFQALSVCLLFVSVFGQNELKAIARIQSQGVGSIPPTLAGYVRFTQPIDGVVTVNGEITGLTPGLHGLHIHQLGDLSSGCGSTGPHFNPCNKSHGGPASLEHHVGDLGNVLARPDGVAIFTFKNRDINLYYGDRNIMGRAVVVHAGVDDLGEGGNEESLKTGNAGARLGCGVIGISA